tara:strand:- start:88 stop:462 length:375 start_codon:yes stop_codon:yes gene_type:complete
MSGLLLTTATYLSNLLTKKSIHSNDLDILIKKVHEYSGLDPDGFFAFITNINVFKNKLNEDPEFAGKFLYIALSSLENIGIMTEFQEDIQHLVLQIGYYAEKMLMDASINKNTAFHPKYLNSRL